MNTQDKPQIDDYIRALPAWQQTVCTTVRKLIHQADSEVQETIKRKLPFFTLNGNICALMATKDHVNIFIYDPIAPDPHSIINQGNGNATARAIQLWEHDQLNEAAFVALVQAVIANNRAGGWRKLA